MSATPVLALDPIRVTPQPGDRLSAYERAPGGVRLDFPGGLGWVLTRDESNGLIAALGWLEQYHLVENSESPQASQHRPCFALIATFNRVAFWFNGVEIKTLNSKQIARLEKKVIAALGPSK